MALCPRLNVVNKKIFRKFFYKIFFRKNFPHPPGVSSGTPERGDSVHAVSPPEIGPPGWHPPRPPQGVPPAKKCQKRPKIGVKWPFWCQKVHIFAQISLFFKSDRGAMQAKKRSTAAGVRCAKTRQFIQY